MLELQLLYLEIDKELEDISPGQTLPIGVHFHGCCSELKL